MEWRSVDDMYDSSAGRKWEGKEHPLHRPQNFTTICQANLIEISDIKYISFPSPSR